MAHVYDVAPRVEFTPLPTGEYVLTLLEIKEIVRDKDYLSYKKGDLQLEFHWQVDVPGAESEERRSWASVPKTWSKKATFTAIAVALGLVSDEEAIANGARVDFDLGLGRRCLGTIVRELKDDQVTWVDTISAYMPLTRLPGPRRRPVPAPSPADSDEADIPF